LRTPRPVAQQIAGLVGLSALAAHYAEFVANAQTGRDFTDSPPFTVVFGNRRNDAGLLGLTESEYLGWCAERATR
jgi:hypothetical protein